MRAGDLLHQVGNLGERLVLVVSDAGIGLSSTTRRSALSNLRQRAERRGGALVLTDQEPTGSCPAWSVPIT